MIIFKIITLVLALFFSSLWLISLVEASVTRQKNIHWLQSMIPCILWGLFYYLVH